MEDPLRVPSAGRAFVQTARTRMASRLSALIDFQANRPAAALVFAFSLGIAISLLVREYSFPSLAAAGVPLICAALFALRRARVGVSLALALAAVAWGGLLTALAHRDGFSDSDLRALVARGTFKLNEPVSFEGCITVDSENPGEESVATVELRAFLKKDRWIPCRGKGQIRVAGYGTAEAQSNVPILFQGDSVRGWATWRRPRNYGNPGSADRKGSLARRGVFIVGRVKSPRLLETVPGGCSSAWTRMAVSVRSHVRRNLEPIRARENGQPAAILASLLVGDYARLNASTRETFQNCGTFHVLVVSGLHVVWIAGLLLQFFRLIRIPERTRLFLVALVILFYTCIVGFQASITRCLWMFVLYLIGRSILRHADPVNVLLSSALLLLAAQPDWLFETGFQLSFLSVTAIAMMAVPAIESYLKPLFAPLRNCGNPDRLFLKPGRWQRWGRSLRTRCEIRIEETTDRLPRAFSSILFRITRGFAGAALAVGSIVVVSLSIQLWIEPILACNFNRISWIAVLANLFIVPFSSLVLAAGIVTVLASVLPCFGPSLVHIAGTLSSLLLRWAGDLAAVSGAWQRCPTPSAAWISGGILLLFVWSYFRWRRIWIPCTYAVVLLACVSQGSLPIIGILIDGGKSILCRRNVEFWPKHRPVLSFTFLDVGQGDSIFIRFPDKRAWLVDAGGLLQGPSREEGAYAFDLGEAVVSRYLWHSWISRLDRLVLSHTDLDHAGGARSVLRNFQVDRIDHPLAVPDRVLSGIADIARQTGAWLHRGAAGASEKIGPVTVEILHPSAKPVSGAANENSLVLRFSFGRFSALLTGDLGKNGEFDMLSRSKTLPGLLLKVAHHGSRFGTSSAFLDAVQPRWAIVSVGRHNPHGHPSPEVLRRLLQHGSGFYLTFDHGAITFETDGSLYRIRSHLNGVLGKGAL